MKVTTHNFKQRAHALIDQLPDNANWKDLTYEIAVLQEIEEGLHESETGQVYSNAEVRQRFGLSE